MTKHEQLTAATKKAFRAHKAGGWSDAKRRARLWCHFMWPDAFPDPRERKETP